MVRFGQNRFCPIKQLRKWNCSKVSTRCLCRFTTMILAVQIFITLPLFLVYSHYQRRELGAHHQEHGPEERKRSHGATNKATHSMDSLKWHGRISPNFFSTPRILESGEQLTIHNPSRNSHNNRRILIWTPIFGNYSIWDDYIHAPGMEDCPSSQDIMSCSYTFDRNEEHLVDAILFHYIDVDLEMKDLPERRRHQKWLLFVEDPPYLHGKRLLDFEGLFNWTITYRDGSDVQRRFGKIEPKREIQVTTSKNEFESITKRIRSYGPRKVAVWLVSNCVTQGRREDFVTELTKYIDVDVYGKCGSYNCTGRMSDECYRHLESRYMFYLAFENSVCKDYVTEKFFNSLKYDFVPVVFGGGNYSKLVQEIPMDGNSRRPLVYINALDFRSPKDLARELMRLAKDERAYLEFFKWKVFHQVVAPYNWHCDLCKKLHKEGHLIQPGRQDLYHWWQTEADCEWWPMRSRGHQPWTWN